MKTEGIRYCGSKSKVLDRIVEAVESVSSKSVLDAFAGTTRVGQAFKLAGLDVHSNDLAPYSAVFSRCYLENCDESPDNLDEKIRHLNALPPVDGWFAKNYGGEDVGGRSVGLDGKKKPLLMSNARKLDAIRSEIDKISSAEIEKSILLTSLINAVDKVENTLGHQVAYLSKWSAKSRGEIVLQKPLLIPGSGRYSTSASDVSEINRDFDLAYFDPPYGTNNAHTPTSRVRYASYYHLWTTIVLDDRPELFGASNRRSDTVDKLAVTPWESVDGGVVMAELKRTVEAVRARHILFSYSNKGKIPVEKLEEYFSTFKGLKISKFHHRENIQKNLTSSKEWLGDQNENLEYLFLFEK